MSNFYLHPLLQSYLGSIELNYHEVQCLEMALYFLKSQVINDQSHKLFADLRKHHIDHLSDWLHNNLWRSELRFDGMNTMSCSIESLEDAKWLALACEKGINEDTIFAMAADDANYEMDMAREYAEKEYNDELYHDACSSSYRAFYNRYCEIARLKPVLASKFRNLLASGRWVYLP